MWQCSKCGQKSKIKLGSSSNCEHQWFDEHDIAKVKEKQTKEQKINRAVLAFNDELFNTEDGHKKLTGENGWSWLEGNKGKEKINIENIDIDKDIAKCWLNSFFGEKWLAGEYGKQYLNYLNEMEKWQAGNTQAQMTEAEAICEFAKKKGYDLNLEGVKNMIRDGSCSWQIILDIYQGKCHYELNTVTNTYWLVYTK